MRFPPRVSTDACSNIDGEDVGTEREEDEEEDCGEDEKANEAIFVGGGGCVGEDLAELLAILPDAVDYECLSWLAVRPIIRGYGAYHNSKRPGGRLSAPT